LKKLERSWVRWKGKEKPVPQGRTLRERYYHSMLEPLYFIFILSIFFDLIFLFLLFHFLNNKEACNHSHMM